MSGKRMPDLDQCTMRARCNGQCPRHEHFAQHEYGSSMQHAVRDTSHMGGHTCRDTYYPLTGAARRLLIHPWRRLAFQEELSFRRYTGGIHTLAEAAEARRGLPHIHVRAPWIRRQKNIRRRRIVVRVLPGAHWPACWDETAATAKATALIVA